MSVKELRPGSPGGASLQDGRPPRQRGIIAWARRIIATINRALYRQAPEVWDSIRPTALAHNIYKSIYRTTAFPKTERERSEAFFNSFLLHIQPAKIEKHALRFTYTFGLGLLSLYLFILLTISGVLLMFVYVPSTEQAYFRMLDIQGSVSYGRILRGMHFWSANAMITVVFLHMCRVFYTGAYKPPREFNWCVGVNLLVLTLVLGFTGYLLPWDQLAFWAITVGAGIAGKANWISDHINYALGLVHIPPLVPALGDLTRWALLGSDTVGQEALLRFYVLHVAVLPLVLTGLIVYHFWRIRKDGGISSPKESPE
jgi:quinol-cytochrome oxidoreductase complex cytochrome b subunit